MDECYFEQLLSRCGVLRFRKEVGFTPDHTETNSRDGSHSSLVAET